MNGALLVFFFLGAAARADEPKIDPTKVEEAKGKAVKNLVRVLDCKTEEQENEVAGFVAAAMTQVDACLMKQNKDIAQKIKKNFKKFVWHCGTTRSRAGAKTIHTVDKHNNLEKADITYFLIAGGSQYDGDARLFHEMIHAVDPPGLPGEPNRDGKLVVSASAHADAGYPDPVYGCQFACFPKYGPGGMGDEESKYISRYMKALDLEGAKPPVDENYDCAKGSDCGPLAVYAGLCKLGKPKPPKAWVESAKVHDLPKCLLEQVINACDLGKAEKQRKANCEKPVVKKSILCRYRCEMDESDDKAGAVIERVQTSLKKIIPAIKTDGEGLEGDDAKIFHEIKLRGLLKICQ